MNVLFGDDDIPAGAEIIRGYDVNPGASPAPAASPPPRPQTPARIPGVPPAMRGFSPDPVFPGTPFADTPPNGGLVQGNASWRNLPTARRALLDDPRTLVPRSMLRGLGLTDYGTSDRRTSSLPAQAQIKDPWLARFIDNVNSACSIFVAVKRRLDTWKPANAQEQTVWTNTFTRWNEMRVQILTALWQFHNENPKFPKDGLLVPQQFEPPPEWAEWAVIVPEPVIAAVAAPSGLGVLPLLAILVIKIVVISTAVVSVAYFTGISSMLFAMAEALTLSTDALKQYGETGDPRQLVVYEKAKQNAQLAKDPLGLTSTLKWIVYALLAAGAIYVGVKYVFPEFKKLIDKRSGESRRLLAANT